MCLLEAKPMWRTQVGSDWATLLGWVRLLTRGHFSQSLSAQSSCLLSMSSLTQGPSSCAHVSFSQDGFQREGYREAGRVYYGWAPHPFPGPWGSFLHMYGLRGLLDPKTKVASLSCTQAELCFCHYLYLEVTGDRFWQLSLGPRYLLLHFQHTWPPRKQCFPNSLLLPLPITKLFLKMEGSACSFHKQKRYYIHQVGHSLSQMLIK